MQIQQSISRYQSIRKYQKVSHQRIIIRRDTNNTIVKIIRNKKNTEMIKIIKIYDISLEFTVFSYPGSLFVLMSGD